MQGVFRAHNYPTCLDSELMALSDTLDAGLRYLGRDRPMPAGVEFPELEPRGDGVPLRREQVDPEEGECEPSSEAVEDRRFSRMTLQVSCRDRKCFQGVPAATHTDHDVLLLEQLR
ncbi:hypothetical protein MTO96_048701 [Rhipicephalus appendiculatus]